MIYSFLSLQTTGLLVGALVLVLHALALFRAKGVQQWLKKFPRSRELGVVLLTVDAIWAFALIAQIDLGEFTRGRMFFLIIIAIAYVLTLLFVDEFLAVRALGMFLILLAEPLLEVAFQRPETGHLLLSVLAYAWATLGIFWVGMPYLLRDQIDWVSRSDMRWRLAALAGVVYGGALIVVSLTQFGA